MDLKRWECGVPGKDNTIWAGGFFKLEVTFPDGMYLFSARPR
jgi:ubiquitin-conjugating enzyme E2 I